MPVLVGVFESQIAAEHAFMRLRDAGVPSDDVVMISNATNVASGPPMTAAELAASQQTSDGVAVEGVVPAAAFDLGSSTDVDRDGEVDADADSGLASRRIAQEEVAPDESKNPGMDGAAIGAAIGLIAGAGLGGPLGAAVGAAAGGSIGGILSARGVSHSDATSYENALTEGRYLVAIEADEPTPEMRAILDVAGAKRVEVA